jgi:hypothetical protein
MKDIKIGDKLKCIFIDKLPGNDYAPKLIKGNEYECIDIHYDSSGNAHINVGLPLELNYVRSYATGGHLPDYTHWCHPNRFIII